MISWLPAHAAPLEEELLTAARSILKHSRERGYENVGVLKFRVQKGDAQPTDKVGPLNHSLPRRLELALVMANRVLSPIGIIHNASAVAEGIDGASHLTASGRQRLFDGDGEYPLAWGESRVTPDAFAFGVVEIQSDLKQMTVAIAMFDRGSRKFDVITQFDTSLTPVELTDVGESFSTRGLFDKGKLRYTTPAEVAETDLAVVQEAVGVQSESESFPLTDPDCPVSLEIAYDGQVVPIEYRDGRAFVREPETDQTVTMTIRRNFRDQQRYAAVLKVNGENTLGRQRQQDLHCRKWVLEPGDRPIVVRGYQTGPNELQQFRVLSKAASKAREMDYGNDVGTISLVVFRELETTERPPVENLLADDAEDFSIIRRGVFPTETPPSLDVLKQRLIAIRTRGLIVEGQTIEGRTRKVTFNAAPLPVLSATITYYRNR